MSSFEKLKEIVLTEMDLVVSITLLLIAVVVNVVSFLPFDLLSFERSVMISLIAISLSISSYLFFRLRKEVTDETETEDAERLLRSDSGLFIHNKTEAYNHATSIASYASDELLVLQRTLIVLLGPRPYDSSEKDQTEQRHFEELEQLVEDAKAGDTVVYCGLMLGYTRKEIERAVEENDAPHLRSVFAKRLYKLCAYSSDPESEFKLFISQDEGMPIHRFIGGDDQFALWFTDTSNDRRAICATTYDEQAVKIFRRKFEDFFQQVQDYETISTALGLGDVELDEENLKRTDLLETPP